MRMKTLRGVKFLVEVKSCLNLVDSLLYKIIIVFCLGLTMSISYLCNLGGDSKTFKKFAAIWKLFVVLEKNKKYLH